MAHRGAGLQIENEPYHFWFADDVPSDEQLKHFEMDPGTAVAMIRLTAGVRKNHLRDPENLRMTADAQSIIDRFSLEAEHNETIKVCVVCSIRDALVYEECKLLSIAQL